MLRHPDPIQPDDDDLFSDLESDDEDTGDEPEDPEHQVARQTNPAPIREEEEEELAEADLQKVIVDDDLAQMEGPDA
jgi:hypothetical protein